MKGPFFNYDEDRPRAALRIIIYIFLLFGMQQVSTIIPEEWIRYVVMTSLAVGLYFFFVRFVDRRSWNKEAGLTIDSTWWKECLAGVIIAGAGMGLIFLTEWLTGDIEITGFAWSLSGNTFWLFPLLSFMVMMICVSILEETMARGYLLRNMAEGFTFGNLTTTHGAILAVLLSSGIFGILHGANPNVTTFAIINIVMAGIMLAIPFVITGRLALPIGLHFSWNFFQAGIFGFPVSGREIRGSLIRIEQGGSAFWTGGSFGPEGGLIGIIAIILILVITVFWLQRTGIEPQLDQTFIRPYIEKENIRNSKDELA